MYCEIVVNQRIIRINHPNIPTNEKFFVGFRSYFCNVKMRFGDTIVDCKDKEISCFLCLEDMVSIFELILEPFVYEEDEAHGMDMKFFIELRYVYDQKHYDKPVFLNENGLLPYCNIYDVTNNNNDKNAIAHISRYAGVVSVIMADDV